MRVQLVKGTVQVPPSYFTIQHALTTPQIDWLLLYLAAKPPDPPLPFPTIEAVLDRLSFRVKETLKR